MLSSIVANLSRRTLEHRLSELARTGILCRETRLSGDCLGRASFDDPVDLVLKPSATPSSCRWPGDNQAYYELDVVQ